MQLQEKFEQLALAQDITVPPEQVEEQLSLCILEEKQRMQYETLTGVQIHLNPGLEIQQRMGELQQLAYRQAKVETVLQSILVTQELPVSREELLVQAQTIAQRQGTTVENLQRFLGEDLSLLVSDIRKMKAMQWLCGQQLS